MGGGNYDREAHRALTTKRASRPREEVFTQMQLHPDMDPKGVRVRESRDSANHPESTGIMFMLDETGSMGDIPEVIAKQEMPTFMAMLQDGAFIADPQVLFGAVGDAEKGYEQAPLQVGQFESEGDLMDKWLTNVYLEGKGGRNNGESYDLAFYFAARHTAMDCWEKRGRKGYLFVTGDEPHLGRVSAREVKKYLGEDIGSDIPMEDIVQEASQTFHPFFLVPDTSRDQRYGISGHWRPLLGDNYVVCESPTDVCVVSAMLIGITEGKFGNIEEMGRLLERLGRKGQAKHRVIRAVEPYANAIGFGGVRRQAKQPRKRR